MPDTAGALHPDPRIVAMPETIHWESLAELMTAVGWGSTHDSPALRAMFGGAVYTVLAEEGGRVVGYVRAFTDRVSVSWIAEIAVHPERQGRGIGGRLMEALLRDLGGTAIYGEALNGSEAFFIRHGVVPRPGKLVAISRRPRSA